MMKWTAKLTAGLCMMATGWMLAGCDDGDGGGGGGSGDIGDNNPNVVVCLGDSITEGGDSGGAPFPSRLAVMTGKTVINEGTGGQRASGGASRAASVLNRHKPAVMTILYGANDLIQGDSPEGVIASLSSIINACRANQTEPVLATLTPMVEGHALWAGGVMTLNDMIRDLASSAGVRLVDLERKFGSDPVMLLMPDGLHPNDAGNQVIADAFAGAL